MPTHHTTTRHSSRRAASTPPIATSSQLPAAADRKLFDIEAKLRKLDPKMREAGRLHNEAEEAVQRWTMLNPEPDKRFIAASAGVYGEEVKVKRKWAAWSNDRRAMLRKCHFAERSAEWSKLTTQLCHLADEVLNIRATTLDGVLCKARIAKGDFSDDDALSSSVVDDLLALQAKN
jgi:hypothetical protein